LAFIRNVKALGLALEEIKEVLAFRDRGASPCPYVLELIDTKAQEIQGRIQGLRILARQLQQLRRAAASISSREIAAKACFCHILENRKILARSGSNVQFKGNGRMRSGVADSGKARSSS